MICERAILRCPPRPSLCSLDSIAFRVLRLSARWKRSRDERRRIRPDYPRSLDEGTPWPFYGIKCTSSRNPDLVSKDESHGRITESAKQPRPTDQTDPELSIKMFTQPRLRRFLSRDKVHNFDVSYKPRCYLSPSEECTFRICLKSIYQPI